MTIYQGEHGEMYQTIEIPGAGKIEAGNNGDVEWERSTLMGPKVKRIASTPGALLSPTPSMSAFWQGRYSKVQTTGVDTVDGKECYTVELTPRTEDKIERHCYDRQTGLLVRTSVEAPELKGQSIQVILRDYREVAGIKAPHQIATEVMGQVIRMDIDEYKMNEPLPAEALELPQDITDLVAKRKEAAQRPPEEDLDRPRLKRPR